MDNCVAQQFAADLSTYKGIESVGLICIAFMMFSSHVSESCTSVMLQKCPLYAFHLLEKFLKVILI